MGALMPKAGATPKVTAVHFRNLPKTERKYIEDAVRELLAKKKTTTRVLYRKLSDGNTN